MSKFDIYFLVHRTTTQIFILFDSAMLSQSAYKFNEYTTSQPTVVYRTQLQNIMDNFSARRHRWGALRWLLREARLARPPHRAVRRGKQDMVRLQVLDEGQVHLWGIPRSWCVLYWELVNNGEQKSGFSHIIDTLIEDIGRTICY